MTRSLELLSDEELAMRVKEGDREAPEVLLTRFAVKIRSIAKEYRNVGQDLDDIEISVKLAFVKAAQTFDPAAKVKFVTYAKRLAFNTLISEWRSVTAGSRPPSWARESIDDPDVDEPGTQDSALAALLENHVSLESIAMIERRELRQILTYRPPPILRLALEQVAQELQLDWVAIRDLLYPGLILIRLAPDPGTPEATQMLVRAHEKFCEVRRALIEGAAFGLGLWETAESVGLSRACVRMILDASQQEA